MKAKCDFNDYSLLCINLIVDISLSEFHKCGHRREPAGIQSRPPNGLYVFEDYNLKFLLWNVQGFSDYKRSDPSFLNLCNTCDIVLVCESWSTELSTIDIPGFVETFSAQASPQTGLKLENYYFFTFTFSRPEVRKLFRIYVFTFSRPEVRKLFRIYFFTFSRPEVRKLFRIYVFTFSRPEVTAVLHYAIEIWNNFPTSGREKVKT